MNFEEQIKQVMSNPEMMSKIGEIASSMGLSPNSGDNQKAEGEAPVNTALPVLNDPRANLLLALKPFLSDRRAPYMDSALSILKMLQIGKLGKDFKLF